MTNLSTERLQKVINQLGREAQLSGIIKKRDENKIENIIKSKIGSFPIKKYKRLIISKTVKTKLCKFRLKLQVFNNRVLSLVFITALVKVRLQLRDFSVFLGKPFSVFLRRSVLRCLGLRSATAL